MKKAFFFITFLFATANTFAQSTVHVEGYTRSNGVYVQEHFRTAPDATISNNWSTIGNINPYTGKPGTVSYPSTTLSNSTPIHSTNLYTGSRGGIYRINSNGNKTYIK